MKFYMYTRPPVKLIKFNWFANIFAVWIVLAPVTAWGQELPFNHYTQESEVLQLPSAEVQSTYQDDLGYIWFVVYSSGLVRYNGQKTMLLSEADGLPVLNIYEILEDHLGRLWVSTDAGLAVSEKPLKDYLLNQRPRFTTKIGEMRLATTSIVHNRMIQDGSGDLWIGTEEHGILRYHFEDLSEIQVDTIKTDLYAQGENRQVTAMLGRNNGAIWVGLDEGDIAVIEPGSLNYKVHTQSSGAPCQTEVMFESSKGELWGGCWNGTIWKLMEQEETPSFEIISDILQNKLIAINEDANGMIWVASYGSGAVKLNGSKVVGIFNQNSGFLSNNINDVFLDREGNLWFAQSGGISKLRPNYNAFFNYSARTQLQGQPLFENASLNAVLRKETNSSIWTGTTGGGITVISQDGTQSQTFTKQHGLLSDRVTSLVEDQQGRIWAGTSEGINCISLPDAANPPPSPLSRSLVFEGKQGRISSYDNHSIYAAKKLYIPLDETATSTIESIWFPGYQHLYCLVDNRWFVFRTDAGLPSTYFHAITADDKGQIWVGTRDRGVFRSNRPLTLSGLLANGSRPLLFPGSSTQVFASEITDNLFSPAWNQSTGAPNNNVETLLWLENELWVGTTEGLLALEGNPLQTKVHLTKEHGLSANNITAMDYAASSETIWIGTNGGLVEIDPESKKVLRTITKQNGLVDNEVWYYGSVFADKQGQILYGTAKGLSVYDPEYDLGSPNLPILQLEHFSFVENNQGDNEAVFEYAALSFSAERSIRYKTRLDGYDLDWSEVTYENKIRYTNLPAFLVPRQYSFEVLAGFQNGSWLAEPLRYTFDVKPAWWLRWWSFLIQIVMAGGLIFGYVRYKTKSQAKALEQEREISNRLKQIDKLKDQFLANTSHELRTPLNGIIGLTESLLDREKDNQKKEDLSMIFTSGRRLASLVNDILDFSKMQNEDLILQLSAVDLRATANVVLGLSRSLARGKPLELINAVPDDIPLVQADENRLLQIFHNLVGNAIKFTAEGFVKITASREPDSMVTITVADSGIGIPEDKVETIFQSFKQADGNTAREYGGTGLGLSITRQLIELHGGKIKVKSKVGEGSQFIFDLPIAPESLKSRKAEHVPVIRSVSSHEGNGATQDEEHIVLDPQPIEIGSAKILVVDDEAVNRKVLNNHLSLSGYQIVQAASGIQALEAINKDQKIDLVLLDIMMPRMSGFEVCQKIREKFMPSEMPIVMITAKDQVTDLIQGLAAGANDYITKPFTKDELLARIKTHLHLAKINYAYGRFVPHQFLRSIGRDSILDVKLGDQVQGEVTVFFSDIRGYSTLAESMSPKENFNFLNAYLRRVGPIIKKHGGFVNQFLGDGIMALFLGEAEDAVKASIEIQKVVAEYNIKRTSSAYQPIKIGIGLHTGPLMLGIIGDGERIDAGVVSDTVNTAARMEGLTKHYGASIILSKTTLDKLPRKDDFNYRGLGLVQVKGKTEALKIYEFYDGDPQDTIVAKQRMDPLFETALNDYFNKEFTHAATAFKEVLREIPEDKAATLYLKRSAEYMVQGVSEDWNGVEAMTEK